MFRVRVILALVVVLLFSVNFANGALVVATQDFETSGDTWGFIASPGTYNTEGDLSVAGSEDVWAAIEEFTTPSPDLIANTGNQFWGMQDLDNGMNPGGESELSFADFDVSSISTGHFEICISYNAVGYDGGDDLDYAIVIDGVQQPIVSLVDGTNNGSGGVSTSGWETVSIRVNNPVSSIGLRLFADQNGGSDYAGFDSIQLKAVVPEPSAFAFVGLVSGLLSLQSIQRKISSLLSLR